MRLRANLSNLGICRLADLRGFLCSKIAFLTTAKRNQLFAGLCERFIYFFGAVNSVPGKACELFEDTSLNQFLYIPFCNRESDNKAIPYYHFLDQRHKVSCIAVTPWRHFHNEDSRR